MAMRFQRILPFLLLLAVGGAWYVKQSARGLDGLLARDSASNHGIPGRWREAPEPMGSNIELISQLEAIGYLDGYEPAGELIGVTVHIPERAMPGYNFYTSGHMQGAFLMDMQGVVLHSWELDFREVFPEHSSTQLVEEEGLQDRRERWRYAHLFANGDVIALYEGFGLIKIDKDSEVVWAEVNKAHHDLHVTPDGHIWMLTREAHVVESVSDAPILEDFVLELDAQGRELRRISVLDALCNSDFATLMDHAPPSGDIFHTNTIEVLSGHGSERASFLAAGNLLLSLPKLDTVLVIDGQTEAAIWGMTGMWEFQHHPTVLPNGHLMVFDNNGHQGLSKVIELDPTTQEVVWSYRGTSENGFHSESCGSNQRLPNGNTLISESDSGRAFEVDREGRIVWEFFNPARAGAHDELIATLFEVLRLPADFPTDWARGPR